MSGDLRDARSGRGARPRVLVLASDALAPHFFPESALERLGELAEWSRFAGREDSPRLRALVAESDALLTTWHSPYLRVETLGAPPRVRLVAHPGGEVLSRMEPGVFDLVTVTNAAGPMAEPVAEMALAMTLALVRRIPSYAEAMRSGASAANEAASEGETLRGRRVGVVGFGRIGRAFARLVAPFGVALAVYDPFCPVEAIEAAGASAAALDDLLASCSVVVLAAGLTPATRGMLDRRRLALIPDGGYLVNVARGGLVDAEALCAELRSRRISAALDVTDPLDPLPPEHELRRLANVVLTPHVAGGGLEVRRAMGAVAIDEVARFFRGEPVENRVTRDMLERMT
jgi:phosphoglycerate dehydrogenase-like enzyme